MKRDKHPGFEWGRCKPKDSCVYAFRTQLSLCSIYLASSQEWNYRIEDGYAHIKRLNVMIRIPIDEFNDAFRRIDEQCQVLNA